MGRFAILSSIAIVVVLLFGLFLAEIFAQFPDQCRYKSHEYLTILTNIEEYYHMQYLTDDCFDSNDYTYKVASKPDFITAGKYVLDGFPTNYLLISAGANDVGVYQVIFQKLNDMGIVVDTVLLNLLVTGKFEVEEIDDITIREGETHTETVDCMKRCKLQKNVNNIDFLKINNNFNYGRPTITLSPQLGDAGEYVLQVRSLTLGQQSGVKPHLHVQMVDVTILPTHLEITNVDESFVYNATEKEKSRHKVACNITCDVSISTNATFASVEEIEDGIESVILLDPQRGDDGQYPMTITASNGIDTVTRNGTIIIEKNPIPPLEIPNWEKSNILNLVEDKKRTFSAICNLDCTITIEIDAEFVKVFRSEDKRLLLIADPQPGDAGEYPMTITATNGIDTVIKEAKIVVRSQG